VLLGLLGTPAWPWFQSFLEGTSAPASFRALAAPGLWPVMLSSSVIVLIGLGLGWWIYGRTPIVDANATDRLGQPELFTVLGNAFYVESFYRMTILRANAWLAVLSDWLDRYLWNGVVMAVAQTALVFAALDNFIDTRMVNGGFDEGCEAVSDSGRWLSLLQNGRVHNYLKFVGGALIVLTVVLLWGAAR